MAEFTIADEPKGDFRIADAPADKPAKPPELDQNIAHTAGEAISNIPSSAENFAKGIYGALRHPIDTAVGLSDVGRGAGQELAESVSGKKIGDNKQKQAFEAIKSYFTKRYGSVDGFKDAVATDPVGVMADASTVLTGGETALSKLGLTKAAEYAGKAAKLTNPLTPVSKAADIVKPLTSKIVPRGIDLKPMVDTARNAGYVLLPHMMTEKPGLISNVLSGWAGKIKTQQAASLKNAEVTDKLAKEALGLKPSDELTSATFSQIRKHAGKAYEAVANAVPEIYADPDYFAKVDSIGGANSLAAKYFPNITKNQGIIDLVTELKGVDRFPTGAGLEIVKELRSNANANFRAFNDPSKLALGMAQRQAADLVDDLMERNLDKAGTSGGFSGGAGFLVDEYRKARQLIAKTYDVESVTNPATGHVNALGLATLADKGKPLTGQLKTIADAATAFPKALQPEARFGELEPFSPWDLAAAGFAAAHGNPKTAGLLLARPAARSAVLSKPYQDRLSGTGGSKAPVLTPKGESAVKTAAKLAPATYQAGNVQNILRQLGQQ